MGQLEHAVGKPATVAKASVLRPNVHFLYFQRTFAFDHEYPGQTLFMIGVANFKRVNVVIVLVMSGPAHSTFIIEFRQFVQPQHFRATVHCPALEHIAVEVVIGHVPRSVVTPITPFQAKMKKAALWDTIDDVRGMCVGNQLVRLRRYRDHAAGWICPGCRELEGKTQFHLRYPGTDADRTPSDDRMRR